jgi:hypothetical protein
MAEKKGRFAASTDVDVNRTKAEIEQVLARFGCTRYAVMTEPRRAAIMFEYNDLRNRQAPHLETCA